MNRIFASLFSPLFTKLLLGAALLGPLYAAQAAQAAYTPSPALQSLSGVPLFSTAPSAIKKQMAAVNAKSDALQYAVDAELPLHLANGLWDSPAAGMARWRVQVGSSGAQTLGLEFAEFSLPEGAALWVYDSSGSTLQGPYTHANETPEGRLWTAIVPGSTAVIELQVPAALKDSVGLVLARANHGFISPAKMESAAAKSGSCQIDAVCPAADSWQEERRSEAMLTISNKYLCSGQLVNNVRGDERPLMLTAAHCQAAGSASSVVSYFNYQSSQCGGAANGSLQQNLSGSSALANDSGADFTLLQLNQAPPAAWQVYYAGWNVGAAIPQSGVVFHHPGGGEKRISSYNTPLYRTPVIVNGVTIQAWGVRWAQGTTESGSSGSGLYNEQHQLVGVLSGGNASCSNMGGTDYFARLEVAYTAQSRPDGQLKAHLDPDNTGVLAVNGKRAGQAAPAVSAPVANAPAAANNSSSVANVPATATAASAGGGGSMGAGLLVLALAGLRRRKR